VALLESELAGAAWSELIAVLPDWLPEALQLSEIMRTSETWMLRLWSLDWVPDGLALLALASGVVDALAAALAVPVISTWCPTWGCSFEVSPESCQVLLLWSRRTKLPPSCARHPWTGWLAAFELELAALDCAAFGSCDAPDPALGDVACANAMLAANRHVDVKINGFFILESSNDLVR
jgi:hypothetical protein